MNPAHAIDDRAGQAGVRSPAGRALPRGTRLREYELADVIGEAGFGIVYRAWDTTLQRRVAVKEFLPVSIATRVAGSVEVTVASEAQDAYKAGLKSFVAEAQAARPLRPRLAGQGVPLLGGERHRVHGHAASTRARHSRPRLPASTTCPGSRRSCGAWLKPILNAVWRCCTTAASGTRTSVPTAIVLTPVGPVLFGFGAAQQTIAALEHTPAAALKPGFAAIEQYGNAAETKRGAWTDLYALAAMIYAAITGSAPAAAADRLAQDRIRCGPFRSSPPACTASASSPRSTRRWRSSPSAGRRITGSSAR